MCVLKQAWSRSYPLVQPVEFIQTGWHRRLHADGEGSSYKFYLNNNLFSILLLIFFEPRARLQVTTVYVCHTFSLFESV